MRQKPLNNLICNVIYMLDDTHKYELGAFQMQILWILKNEPMHGYAIMKKLESMRRDKVDHSALYPALQKLEKSGYIEVKEKGARQKKIYGLTPSGKAIMEKSCEDFVLAFSDIIQDYKCKRCGLKNCGERE